MPKIHFRKQRNSEHHEYEIPAPQATALSKLLDFLHRDPEFGKSTTIVIQRADPAPGQTVLGPIELEPGRRLEIGLSGHKSPGVDDDEETVSAYQQMHAEMVESKTITIRVFPLD